MKTTCPHCNTAFRVRIEQLEQHGGDVRCGRCGEIFCGYDHLDEQTGLGQGVALAPAAGHIPVQAGEAPLNQEESQFSAIQEVESSAVVDFDLGQPALEIVSEAIPCQKPEADVLENAANTYVGLQNEPVLTAQPIAVAEPAREDAAQFLEEELDEPQPSRRGLWVTGCLVALAGLVIQAGILFRTELSIAYPGTVPVLEQLCSIAGCSINLPSAPDLLSIESSELQADPVKPETITLIANLRNRSSHPMAYPLLELTLTDAQDKMVARRIFRPVEYYPNGNLGRGFAPGGDIQVKLPLLLKDLRAVGYRLYLYYPQL